MEDLKMARRAKVQTGQKMTFSASDITEIFGHSVHLQSTWRSKGFLGDYGVLGTNGRYTYGYLDMLGFFIADMIRSKVGVEVALTSGRLDANTLLHWAKSLASGSECAAPRYRIFTHTLMGSGDSVPVRELSEFDEDDSLPVMVLVDFRKMAAELPEYFKALAPLADTE